VGGLTAYVAADGTMRAAYASWTRGHEAATPNPSGVYSRQVSWARILVSGTDPGSQTVTLG
jgi:hypothetical protein